MGIERGWWMGEEETDALVRGYFRGRGVPKGLERSYLVRAEEVRKAFHEERMEFISKRVWQEGERVQRHLEDSISEALSEGMSAGDLSRKIREDLRYPDKLFRRVRDKYGDLVLSRGARAFHPGRGVCRSSARNALRLARTEINTAYRTADHERWQGLDFVKGVRVSLSHNHTCNGVPFTDICDDLAGVYPKDFKFTGWHPQCRCIATTVLEDFDAFLERKTAGGEAPEGVSELPESFKRWAVTNADRIARADQRGKLPHWYRDNQKLIEGGGGQKPPTEPPKRVASAGGRKPRRTPEEAQRIQKAWLKHNRQRSLQDAKKALIGTTAHHPQLGDIHFTGNLIKEAINQPHKNLYYKNLSVKEMKSLIPRATYEGSSIDTKGRGWRFHYLKYDLMGEPAYIVIREIKGKSTFYSIVEQLNKK